MQPLILFHPTGRHVTEERRLTRIQFQVLLDFSDQCRELEQHMTFLLPANANRSSMSVLREGWSFVCLFSFFWTALYGSDILTYESHHFFSIEAITIYFSGAHCNMTLKLFSWSICLRRFAKYYKMENGTDYRTLVKAYAIRFDVLVNGNVSIQYSAFDLFPINENDWNLLIWSVCLCRQASLTWFPHSSTWWQPSHQWEWWVGYLTQPGLRLLPVIFRVRASILCYIVVLVFVFIPILIPILM